MDRDGDATGTVCRRHGRHAARHYALDIAAELVSNIGAERRNRHRDKGQGQENPRKRRENQFAHAPVPNVIIRRMSWLNCALQMINLWLSTSCVGSKMSETLFFVGWPRRHHGRVVSISCGGATSAFGTKRTCLTLQR